MLRLLLLVFAAIAALVLPTAASADTEPGLWGDEPGLQHLHFQTGPITVRPGQNGIENVVLPASQRPQVDGFIVRARPDLTYLNGKVPPVDVIHLHHGVWLNASGKTPASPLFGVEPVFFGGEEKTVFRIPKGYGYPYKASDVWVLNEMIHNNTPNGAKVRLVWDLDFIPADSALAQGVKAVKPLWMDVRRGWGYPVFNVLQGSGGADGRYTFPADEPTSPYGLGEPQNQFTMPWTGTAVAAVGHLHPGGLTDDLTVTRAGAGTRLISRTEATYYDPVGPVSWDLSLTASKPSWRVRLNAGDRIDIQSTYDSRFSSWYENMGIVLLFVAPDDLTGTDPFEAPVDPNGELTHGHLRENDNHGGGRLIYPDARKAGGRAVRRVQIRNYRFVPGDLGSLYAKGARVPVVRRGQSLEFVNRDDPNVEWHSVTTCRVPCNRATGISYPLANGGGQGLQFDSGQLGNGPAGLSPATNRLTWKTPATLGRGTYTYFCRIHPFMRGAFRVK